MKCILLKVVVKYDNCSSDNVIFYSTYDPFPVGNQLHRMDIVLFFSSPPKETIDMFSDPLTMNCFLKDIIYYPGTCLLYGLLIQLVLNQTANRQLHYNFVCKRNIKMKFNITSNYLKN